MKNTYQKLDKIEANVKKDTFLKIESGNEYKDFLFTKYTENQIEYKDFYSLKFERK